MNKYKFQVFVEGFSDPVSAVHVFHRDQQLITGCISGKIILWDFYQNKKNLEYQPHTLKITSVLYSSSTSTIISSAEDSLIILYNLQTRILRRIETNSFEIFSLALTARGQILSTHSDKTIKLWNQDNLKRLSVFHGHKFPVLSILLIKSGTEMYTGSCDCDIFNWNINKMRIEAKLEGHSGYVNALVLNSEESQLFSGSSDGLIKVWQVTKQKKFLYNFRGHTQEVMQLSIIGKFLFSYGSERAIRKWNLHTKICEKKIEFEFCVLAMIASKYLYIGCGDFTLRVLDENLEQVKGIMGHSGGVCKVIEFGQLVLSAGHDGFLKVWNSKSGELQMNINAHFGGVLDFDADFKKGIVVSCGKDLKVKLWSGQTWELQTEIQNFTKKCFIVRILRSSCEIGFLYDDRTFCVYNLVTGTPKAFLRVKNDSKSDSGLSRSYKYLITRNKGFSFLVLKLPISPFYLILLIKILVEFSYFNI